MTKPHLAEAIDSMNAEASKSPAVRGAALAAIQAFARGDIDKQQLDQETKAMKEHTKGMRAKIKAAKGALRK